MSNCKIRTANTGASRCPVEMGRYAKAIIIPKSARFTGGSLDEWIEEGIHGGKASERFYPMPEMTNVEDGSTDNVEWTDGFGNVYTLAEGNYGFTQNFKGDVELNKKLQRFNTQEFRVLVIDNVGNCQGVQLHDGFTGEICNVWVSQPKANTATELAQPTIRYMFLSPSEHKQRAIKGLDLDAGDFNGLEDVEMKVEFASPNFEITFSISGIDVTSELQAISAEETAWLTDNDAQVSTAPTYSSGKFTVASSVLEGKDILKLADPSVLYNLGITNKECTGVELPATT